MRAAHRAAPSTYFQAWAATEGGPEAVPWDRSRREIVGSWEEDNGCKAVDVDGVITPLV